MNGSEIVAVHVHEARDRRVAVAARERVADGSVDDVLLVRTHGTLRRQRLTARPHRRRRVHALGAVAGGAATRRDLHGSVDVLAAYDVDRAAREHRTLVAAVAVSCSAGAAAAAQSRDRSCRPSDRPTRPSRSAPPRSRHRSGASRHGSRSSCTSRSRGSTRASCRSRRARPRRPRPHRQRGASPSASRDTPRSRGPCGSRRRGRASGARRPRSRRSRSRRAFRPAAPGSRPRCRGTSCR